MLLCDIYRLSQFCWIVYFTDAGIQNGASNVVPAALHQSNGTQEDTHCCGKCRLVFTSLDSYIQHKLSVDNCKVTYTKGNRWLIPRIVIKKETSRVAVKNDENRESSKSSPQKKGTWLYYDDVIV